MKVSLNIEFEINDEKYGHASYLELRQMFYEEIIVPVREHHKLNRYLIEHQNMDRTESVIAAIEQQKDWVAITSNPKWDFTVSKS